MGRLVEVSYGTRGESILLYRFPDNSSFFLLGLGTRERIRDLREQWQRYCKEKCVDPNTQEGKKNLIRTCRRAYPLSMLDDKDFWVAMEKDIRSNFYLSEEEMGLVSQSISFPLFINGRAGSGKSTVLQYLFAEYLLRYLAHSSIAPPLYLSYSVNLIENAKNLSKSLFGKNNSYLEKLKKIGKGLADIEPYFPKTFYVFQDLIRKTIGTENKEVLSSRFARGEKYVNYSKFRKMWMNQFGQSRDACKKYGPAVSWHVIRSYIKGWDSDNYLEPEQYARIGRNNKTVSDETFQIVFTNVWEGWYQKIGETHRSWDDQDLVRYCLAPDDDTVITYVRIWSSCRVWI